jgi:O-antigen ligase
VVAHEQIDAHRAEVTSRRWPGLVFGFGAAMLLASARLTTVMLFGLLAVWAILARDQLKLLTPRIDAVTLSLAALLGYALLSSLWAASLVTGIGEAAMAAVIATASLILLQLVQLDYPERLFRLGKGLWIGFVIGLIFFLIEETSGQAIKIWLYNHLNLSDTFMPADGYHRWANGKLVAISNSTLSRNVAPMTPLLWGTIMAVLGGFPGRWSKAVAAGIYVLACAVIFLSPHETSKVAVVAGSLMLAVAYFWREWAYRALKLVWVIACLFVVPAAFLANKLDLQHASWLQPSAQHRIVIWAFTAEQVLKAPIFGSGIYTTYIRGPEISATAETKPGERFKRGMSRHAHNVFLQTWFEFGLAGACLLLGVGLALLGHLRRLSDQVQPFALAALSSSTVLMSSSYGMWQDWFLSLFALTAIFFAIGARIFDLGPAAVSQRA